MTSVCFDCEKPAPRFYNYSGKTICASCTGWRDELAMRTANEFKLFLFNDTLYNATRSFHLPAIVTKGTGEIFPDVNHVQAVFDSSVWYGLSSWDNIDGAVLMKRTKKKYMPNGDVI